MFDLSLSCRIPFAASDASRSAHKTTVTQRDERHRQENQGAEHSQIRQRNHQSVFRHFHKFFQGLLHLKWPKTVFFRNSFTISFTITPIAIVLKSIRNCLNNSITFVQEIFLKTSRHR